jgi:NADH:ubiquinone oxidoreductase subunit 6 (subunit J)
MIIISIFIIIVVNPIESLLYLILNFLISSLIFLRLGGEFLGLLYLIIYIGAIFILFIFIIMMLNLRIIYLYVNYYNYLYIIILISIFFLFEIFIFIFLGFLQVNFYLYDFKYEVFFFITTLFNLDNLSLIGSLLYNYFFYIFILLGVILLIAMICVILLLLDESDKKENKFIELMNIQIKKIYG